MKKKAIVIISIIILCMLGIYYFYGQGDVGLRFDDGQQSGNLPGKTAAEIQEDLDNEVEKSMFAVSINSEPEFPDGRSKGNLRIENSVNNHYLMVVKLYKEGTKDLLYESGAILPGNYIEYGTLKISLEKGRYPVEAQIEAYDQETEKYIGRTVAKLHIVIKS